jgi:ribose 5-phosphate isomerase A
MTIYERAVELVRDGSIVGLGSGRASTKFIEALGQKVQRGFKVRGVPTSQTSADLGATLGIPIISLEEAIAAGGIDVAVDGADECDPNLDLIKGYGRALVREKIVAAAAKKFVVIFGNASDGKDVKDVPKLGTKGKLPVEVVTFAEPLCRKRLADLGCKPVLWMKDGKPALTDNGNYILDCGIRPLDDARAFEAKVLDIPGVVDTGLFMGMADLVLVGDDNFTLVDERSRKKG